MNAFCSHDDPQLDNQPTQETPGKADEFAYNSHIGNRKKFRPTTEDREAKQSLEMEDKDQEKLHWDAQIVKELGKASKLKNDK